MLNELDAIANGFAHLSIRRARTLDPETSHDAAASMTLAANRQCAQVLNALRSIREGGAEQIAEACGLDAYQVRKRTSELQDAGLIETTGERRKTRSGRSERVWRVAL
jgi:predicted ArsR family transcriptional regulator